MGSSEFFTVACGKTAKKAFSSAIEKAQYDHGHSGYTGTIAEKDSFILLDLEKETSIYIERRTENKNLINKISAGQTIGTKASAKLIAETLMDEEDPRISEKWGPAGCFELGNDEWLFFGWASN